MSGGKNQRALLMEILVAVLFFNLCAAVLLQTFIASRDGSRKAGLKSEALTQLQVLSERLYAAEDAEALLQSEGFALADGAWTRDEGAYVLTVTSNKEETASGCLLDMMLTATNAGETVTQLHSARYLPGEVQP